MSIVISSSQPHPGEELMHTLLSLPPQESPKAPYLTPGAAKLASTSPLLALGILDKQGRPWTTVWAGVPGEFVVQVAQSALLIRTDVDPKYDPVVRAIFDSEGVEEKRMMSALSIDLVQRKRVKLFGRVVGKRLFEEDSGEANVAMILDIQQSLPNCPKYLNCKTPTLATPKPELVSDSPVLTKQALDLIARADMFFISTSNANEDMDTNYRGGPAGFVRVVTNTQAGNTTLVYPEYSGNRLYETLGNLKTTPLAGLCFPDMTSGDVLYVTGEAEVLIGKDAQAVISRSDLAVRIQIISAKLVKTGLGFRAAAGELSPYTPSMRYLAAEKAIQSFGSASRDARHLTIVNAKHLTPTISRYTFRVEDRDGNVNIHWRAGQYAILSFAGQFNVGYSHMRDDDPRSLNDDYVRTFTICSPPPPLPLSPDAMSTTTADPTVEFDLIIRSVGQVTRYLSRRDPASSVGFSLPLLGIAGEFQISMSEIQETGVVFVAGGVGITPLLSHLPNLARNPGQLDLYWSIAAEDIRLAVDTFQRYPWLGGRSKLFVTRVSGNDAAKRSIAELEGSGVWVYQRRMTRYDLAEFTSSNNPREKETDDKRWYVCAGSALRKEVEDWLGNRPVVCEDFVF